MPFPKTSSRDQVTSSASRLRQQLAPLRTGIDRPSAHVLADDWYASYEIARALQITNSQWQHRHARQDERPMQVAVIVGSGYLFSILPELEVDIVLVVDNNRFVLNWMERSIDLILNSATPRLYLDRLADDSEPVVAALEQARNEGELWDWSDRHPGEALYSGVESVVRIERQRFEPCRQTQRAPLHFLSSIPSDPYWGQVLRGNGNMTRYPQCRRAVGNTPIITVNMDIRDGCAVEHVASAIRREGAVITYFSATNVAQFGGPITLRDWPIAFGDMPIMRSTRVEGGRVKWSPAATFSRGAAAYEAAVAQEARVLADAIPRGDWYPKQPSPEPYLARQRALLID
jgi:hypothetical protein